MQPYKSKIKSGKKSTLGKGAKGTGSPKVKKLPRVPMKVGKKKSKMPY